jgi:hypothetical protein
MAIQEFDPEYAAVQLGPQGPGFIACHEVIDSVTIQATSQELAQPTVPWEKSTTSFTDQQGRHGEQQFDVFGHKLSRGDQTILQNMPAFRSLTDFVTQQIVKPLEPHFRGLIGWEADEITAQRYPAGFGKLDFHHDNARHTGLIAICDVTGSALLHVEYAGTARVINFGPSDIVLLRAPGLFAASLVDGDIRPRHAVNQVTSEGHRTSATIRANKWPNRPIRDFHYHNWPS